MEPSWIRRCGLLFICFVSFPLCAPAQQSCVPPPKGMVGWWQGDGNYKDIIGGNNGTMASNATFADGKVGKAFSFNGVDSVVVVPNSLTIDITTDLTIDAWINPASATRGYIVAKGDGNDFVDAYTFRYGAGDDESLLLSVADGSTGTRASYFVSNPGVVPVGMFSHVAVTIQGTTATMYVNGMKVGGQYLKGIKQPDGSEQIFPATQLTANRFSDQGSLRIGNRLTDTLPFGGLIDEVEVFNGALKPEEIQAIFNADRAGKCKPCQVSVDRMGQCDGKDNGANGFPAPHWGGESYGFHIDNAGNICHWGCALTALSMCLTNSGVRQIPNFSDENPSPNPVVQDPGFLNSLMNRDANLFDYDISEDGTDNNVDFDATTRDISNLLKLSRPLHFDSTFSLRRSLTSLEKALCHPGQGDKDKPTPVIVKVKSQCSGLPLRHFVVVTGKIVDQTGTERFKIADPAGTGTCLNGNPIVTGQFLDGPPYNNQFQIVGSVTDPAGDVSGLDFVVGDSADLVVTDPNGRRTGFDPTTGSILQQIPGASYLDEAIDDDETGTAGLTNRSVNIFQPAQGTYQATITGLRLGAYSLEVIPFAQDGSAEPRFSISTIAGVGSSTTFQVQFSSITGAVSQVTLVATFPSTLADISNSLQLGLIDNQGIANSLSEKIQAAQAATGPARNNILNAFKNEVNAQQGKHITGIAPQVLIQDAESLISQNP